MTLAERSPQDNTHKGANNFVPGVWQWMRVAADVCQYYLCTCTDAQRFQFMAAQVAVAEWMTEMPAVGVGWDGRCRWVEVG